MVKIGKKIKHSRRHNKKTKRAANSQAVSAPQQIFQQALTFHQTGRLGEAEALYRQVLTLKSDYAEAHYNLGLTLFGQGRLDEATVSFNQAITIKPDYIEAHYNLGVVLQDLGRLEEAAASYGRVIALKPGYAAAHYNLGTIFYRQGRLEEAVKSMQTAVEIAPGQDIFSDDLLVLLNNFMPNTANGSPYVKAQKQLQEVSREYANTKAISDETVQRLYRKCREILALHNLNIHTTINQLYRGVIATDNCNRHKRIFDNLKIIPEYCFSCYKVTIHPRTVMELFKLLFVFEMVQLPADNSRKCIIEVRPNISGTYKGFIYCRSLHEANEILHIVQPLIAQKISEKIPIVIKRGCSEFQATYPAFGQVTDNQIPQMSYKEAWREQEAAADRNMPIEPPENPYNFSHNHSGLTLLDILVMDNWLAYAAKIGDLSYQKIRE